VRIAKTRISKLGSARVLLAAASVAAILALVACSSEVTTTTAPPTTGSAITIPGVATAAAQTRTTLDSGGSSVLTCTECHNGSSTSSGKQAAWATSLHGRGATTAYAGGRVVCNGCHSGGGFADRIASGTKTADIKTADPIPSRIDCQACHVMHQTWTYAKGDFPLRTEAPVTLEASGAVYDGGKGNLCANCHQPRASFPEAKDGKVSVTFTRWGAHHGPVAAMLLGVGGAGGVTGKPSAHATTVKDTCVTCHMGGEDAVHTFAPVVARCQACHVGAKDFDVNGAQAAIKTKLEEVKTALTAKGLLNEASVAVVGDYPEAEAAALWNYLFVEEDKSNGVHNSTYANSLLDQALAALK
jgi:hypothetical protein